MNDSNEKLVADTRTAPKITVAMLVRNEVAFLGEALDCILQQQFSDFELLIYDNASSDGSETILDDYARKDSRIRLHRSDTKVSVYENFERAIDEAGGEYFVLAAGHDRHSPNFLRLGNDALDTTPFAVTAVAGTVWIDADGKTLDFQTGLLDTTGYHEVNRFTLAIWMDHNCMYGIHRTARLRETSYRNGGMSTETLIVQELAVRGSIRAIPEAQWFRRVTRPPECAEIRIERYYSECFSATPRIPIFPCWRIPFAVIFCALRSPVSWSSRFVMALTSLTVFLYLRDELVTDVRCFPRRLWRILQRAVLRKKY
jgi:glycosyltransferase involved in cell wall biosynthesis